MGMGKKLPSFLIWAVILFLSLILTLTLTSCNEIKKRSATILLLTPSRELLPPPLPPVPTMWTWSPPITPTPTTRIRPRPTPTRPIPTLQPPPSPAERCGSTTAYFRHTLCHACQDNYIPFCSNIGVTYRNRCQLNCARNYCNQNIRVKFEGVCPVPYQHYG